MVRREDMFIYNLEGVIHQDFTPCLYIKIVDRRLIDYKIIGNWSLKSGVDGRGISYFKGCGVSYYTVNEFFKDRVVLDGAMWVKSYLEEWGLITYDFEKIVKASCGWNPRDRRWIKFEEGRFQSFDDIVKHTGVKRIVHYDEEGYII